MTAIRLKALGIAALTALLLSGCVPTPPSDTTSARPAAGSGAGASVSAESQALARYYRNIEARLVRDGYLRTDDGQSDAPFSAATLARNFERIALYDEYQLVDGRFVARQTPSRLRRWEAPVRLQAHFGASVDAAQRASDQAVLSTYATRLQRVTGHPVRSVSSGGNFHVLYLNRDELRGAGALVRSLVPGVSDATLREIENLPRTTFCTVFAFWDPGGRPLYVSAVAIIRDEHPALLRRACVHEEVAQGMGLPNDSPAARPTIFNDDYEFALLTRHDELLLRILYDQRLSIGMRPDNARLLVNRIARQYVGGPS